MIEAHEVRVVLGGRAVLEGAGIAAPDGEVVGLVGPNGSGKSTLLRCLHRSLEPVGGVVLLDGRAIERWAARDRARRLAAVPQDPPLVVGLTVADFVLLGRTPHRRDHQAFIGEDRRVAADAVAAVGLTALASRKLHELSGGERQRVLIARGLAQGAATLLLDEPTNHLDVRYQHELLALVRELGLATVVVLHDLNLAARYCDRVVLLDAGRVVATGAAEDVLEPQRLAAVYGVSCRRLEDVRGPVLVFG